MKNILKLTVLLSLALSSSICLASRKAKVLIVLTSHTKLGNSGKKTGFWLPELTHPYYEFKKAGLTVDVASVQGGMAPVDQSSFEEKDEYNERFLNDAKLMRKVMRSIPLSSINPKEYGAIVFSGGSGAMWDFPNNQHVNRISREIYESEGIVSAICHGPAALVDIRLTNGKYLVAGKRVSAFTNEEEGILGQTKILPFLLQDKLGERGAKHVYGKAFEENVVVDGRLITGQNPKSAKKVAEIIIEKLRKR